MSQRNFEIVSGRAHEAFAVQVAEHLDMPLTQVGLGDFPSGETNVRIEESIRGKHVFVLQSHGGHLQPNTAIMEHGLLVQTVKSASASEATAVSPYLGYMRQDKKIDGRVAESARFVVDLLANTAGADRLVSIDLHSAPIQSFTSKPFDHFRAAPALEEYIRENFVDEMGRGELVIVSPDVGRTVVAGKMQQRLGLDFDDMAIVNKRRSANTQTGSTVTNDSSTHGIVGSIKGKVCLLIDDMVDTAGTLCAAAEALMNEGEAKEVYAFATHPVLSKDAHGVEPIDKIGESAIKRLIVTDTLPLLKEDPYNKIHVVSLAPLVSRAIRRIAQNESVSALF